MSLFCFGTEIREEHADDMRQQLGQAIKAEALAHIQEEHADDMRQQLQ
jgi:hypothetical protein